MVTSLICATASSAGKTMSWSGSPSVYGALEAAVAAASSSRSFVAFKGIAVPAAKSLSVCSGRDDDDDDDDDVDIVQRGRRRRRGSSVQATVADAVKLDVSKATGSDSHNVMRVRLVRFGRKKLPFHRIFVAHSRARRDGRHIELLGFYNPLAGKDGNKEISIKSDRVKYWLSVGAQPTDTVRGLYRAGLMKPPTQP
ncbi:unnamed protein product [Sphagnum troendelagicum]|uniref:Ribosomal protein S16 n=1 Tax=Sphagnum troendelagicum TaxID=128251 RepID=A0ABP0TKH1_9BRYO